MKYEVNFSKYINEKYPNYWLWNTIIADSEQEAIEKLKKKHNKDTISGWYQFCKEQNFVKADNTVGVIFTLKEEARVYTIDSKEDLDNLVNKYPNDVLEILKERAGLNFIAVSKDYDAIYLTDKGQWATRFSQPNTLYGWDCETLLVLNFNAIDLDSMEKYKE